MLLGMYNQELLDKNGKPRVYSFRLPSLAQASPYHDPMHLAPASLTESALRRWEECNTHLVQKGPYQPVSKLVAQNRLAVLSSLMVLYNSQRSGSSSLATEFLCKAVSRQQNIMGTESLVEDWLTEFKELDAEEIASYAESLDKQEEVTTAVFRVLEDRVKYADVVHRACGEPVVQLLPESVPSVAMLHTAVSPLTRILAKLVTQGFNKQSSHQRSSYDSSLVPPTLPRIPVNSEFLLELLEAVHLALYSKFSNLAQQSLEDIHFRANHELLPDVLVVTTALRNILHLGVVTEAAVVPSNMSPVLSGGPTLHKSLITNASFRTKKLPDDIPIQDKKEDGDGKNLESISEEGVEGKSKPAKEGGIKVVVKLPSLVKKKSSDPKTVKGPKRKPEPDEADEIVVFSPEMSPPPISEQQDNGPEFEMKQRDSVV
ncbi:hypothetical protein B566_EDAN004381 [Ephemera danica]|nr:hypothetical protein B566_EDAN004381 [Ephemera danica]